MLLAWKCAIANNLLNISIKGRHFLTRISESLRGKLLIKSIHFLFLFNSVDETKREREREKWYIHLKCVWAPVGGPFVYNWPTKRRKGGRDKQCTLDQRSHKASMDQQQNLV